MNQRFEAISKAADALEQRIDEKRSSMEQHGVLDGELRLKMRNASIEVARLKEQIRHFGERDVDRHATDSADVTALSTQVDYWTAQIDREFKA